VATTYSPIIKKDDYDAFRSLINSDMPDTFDEWAYQRGEADLQYTRRGLAVRRIEVHPDGFVAYLLAQRAKASRHELDSFAAQEAARQNRDKE
jgi:hypothetical protein